MEDQNNFPFGVTIVMAGDTYQPSLIGRFSDEPSAALRELKSLRAALLHYSNGQLDETIQRMTEALIRAKISSEAREGKQSEEKTEREKEGKGGKS